MTTVFVSAAAGALVGSLITVMLNLWREQVRLKAETMLSALRWYEHRLMLFHQWQAVMERADSLDEGEERETRLRRADELADKMVAATVSAGVHGEITVAFGDGEQARLWSVLHDALNLGVLLLVKDRDALDAHLENRVVPIAATLLQSMAEEGSVPIILAKLRRQISGPIAT